MESLDKLKETLKTNLEKEENQKAEQKTEIEIFDKIIKDSEFGEIPEVLVTHEKQKMFHELKDRLTQQGIEIGKYLKDLKKTEEEIHNDFAEQAAKRVKSALISRQVAKDNDLKPTKEDLDKEIALIKKTYPDNKDVAENLKRADVLDTLATAVQNRKVIVWLKEKVLESDKK